MSLFSVVRGSGLPVLFLHGLSADHKMMLSLDSAFQADSRSWERHYLDLPGSGRSRRLARMNSRTVVDAVCEYVDSNFSQPVFALVGVSYGAFVARALHSRYEPHVLGSALLSAGLYPSEMSSAAEERVLKVEEFLLGESVPAVPSTTRPHFDNAWTNTVGPVFHDRYASSELLANYSLEPYPETASTELLGGKNLSIMSAGDSVTRWQNQFDIMDFYCPQSYAVIEAADVERSIADWVSVLD